VEERQRIVAAIDAGFAPSADLGPRDLVTGESWEDSDLRTAFAPVTCGGEISSELIWRHRDSLPAFTPRGLAAVLPYYLRFCLFDSRLEVADFVIYLLSSADLKRKFWLEFLLRLNANQRRAICMFIQYFSDRHDVATTETVKAAREFWCCEPVLLGSVESRAGDSA
jgi:hypothetical protein